MLGATTRPPGLTVPLPRCQLALMAYDLIVIGGGLVGGAIAWGAAAKGASVALLDQGDIAYRAARGNFGLVWVQSKGAGMPAYAHWTRTSAELWPDLAGAMAGATGVDVALQQRGGLAFCLSDEEMAKRARRCCIACTTRAATSARACSTAPRCSAMVPGLGDRVVGASFCPIDGHAQSALSAARVACGAVATWRRLPARPHGRCDRCRAEQLHSALSAPNASPREARDRRGPRQPRSGADGRPVHAGDAVARPDHRHRAAAAVPGLHLPHAAPDSGRLGDAGRFAGGCRLRHLHRRAGAAGHRRAQRRGVSRR